MIERPFSREQTVRHLQDDSLDVAMAVRDAGDTRIHESTVLTSTDWRMKADPDNHDLVGSVYVTAQFHEGLHIKVLKNVPTQPGIAVPAFERISEGIKSIPENEELELVDDSLLRHIIIGTIVDKTMGRRSLFLTGIELWIPSFAAANEASYTTLITPRVFRHAPRIISERMLALKRAGQHDSVVRGYEAFSFTQVPLSQVARDVSASMLEFINRQESITGIDATMDTEPGDTH